MLIGGSNADEASHSRRRAHEAFGIIAPESGVSEADAHRPLHGNHQAGGIEKWLGKNESLQGRAMPELHAPPTQERFVPNLDQAWRVVVAKVAVLNHEAIPSSPVVWALRILSINPIRQL